MRRPRVGIDVHCLGKRQTGNETYMRNLIAEFAQRMLPFDIYHYYTGNGNDLLPIGGLWRRVVPHLAPVRIPVSFPFCLLRDGIDLAHFQYVAPPVCPCPTILTVHDISYEHFPEYFNPLQRKRMQTMIPLSARKAAHVLTVSEYSKRDLVERYGLDEDRITVTYNGVADAFHPLSEAEALDATRGFQLTRPFILGVGNLQPRKNLERLIRAYARLRQNGTTEHQLVLVGQSAWQGNRIFDEVRRLGLEGDILFTGYVSEPELIGLYNRADVFAYPSTFEGFGLPVVEAMACGTPVLTSNTSSLPEVSGNAAVTVDPYDDEAIEHGLRMLLTDQPLRARLRMAGQAQAGRFSWPSVAQKTLEVYASVLGIGLESKVHG